MRDVSKQMEIFRSHRHYHTISSSNKMNYDAIKSLSIMLSYKKDLDLPTNLFIVPDFKEKSR